MIMVEINKNVKLSEHFTLAEMTKTSVKTKDGNIPSRVHIENLKRLCGWLERLRQRCNQKPHPLTDGIETLQLARGMMAVYTVSGIPVYNGPADDFHRQQVRRGEHYHKE